MLELPFVNELLESLNAPTYVICHALNSQHWNLVLLRGTRSIRIARAFESKLSGVCIENHPICLCIMV